MIIVVSNGVSVAQRRLDQFVIQIGAQNMPYDPAKRMMIWKSVPEAEPQIVPAYFSIASGSFVSGSLHTCNVEVQLVDRAVCCKCGSDLLGDSDHSDWCPKYVG